MTPNHRAKPMQILILSLYLIGSACFFVATAINFWQVVKP